MTVPISQHLAGPSNSAVCLTDRIVDLRNSDLTDYIRVCRDADGNVIPDSLDDDGNPTCAPYPPGRIPPAWNQTTLPAGAIATNPDPEALTGLESWFWYDGPVEHAWPSPVHEGRTADCRILPAPARVTYTARLSTFEWDIGDSRPARSTSTKAGTEEAPAARHVYRTKGTWDAALTCTWTGAPRTPLTMPCAERTISVIAVRATLTD